MIRKAASHETEEIIRIWLDASRLAHDFIPFAYWADRVQDMRDIDLPHATTFVYDLGERISGFIALSDATIAALFVAPEHQRRGYGKALVQFAQTQSQRLSLCVYKNNAQALRFYRASGFTATEERIDSNTRQAEIVMTWEVS